MKKKDIWWDLTRNPVVGCSKISEGCQNCWAQRFAMRQVTLVGPTGDAYRDVVKAGKWTGVTRFVESALKRVPGKGKVVFVSDMGDLWHETMKLSWIQRVLEWAKEHPQHTFVSCTKRPGGLVECACYVGPFPPNWVQLVSVEDQKTTDERVPYLLDIQTSIRGLHLEPLLGPVDLEMALEQFHTLDPMMRRNPAPVSWIVVGAETGPGARPCDPAWVQSIVDQCQSADVPVWVKQAPGGPWPRQKPVGMP